MSENKYLKMRHKKGHEPHTKKKDFGDLTSNDAVPNQGRKQDSNKSFSGTAKDHFSGPLEENKIMDSTSAPRSTENHRSGHDKADVQSGVRRRTVGMIIIVSGSVLQNNQQRHEDGEQQQDYWQTARPTASAHPLEFPCTS